MRGAEADAGVQGEVGWSVVSRAETSRGEEQLLPRAIGENRPQSAVRGVLRVGVLRSCACAGRGVVRARGVLRLASAMSRGDLSALRASENSRNLGVLRPPVSGLGVVRMSVLGDIRAASLILRGFMTRGLVTRDSLT